MSDRVGGVYLSFSPWVTRLVNLPQSRSIRKTSATPAPITVRMQFLDGDVITCMDRSEKPSTGATWQEVRTGRSESHYYTLSSILDEFQNKSPLKADITQLNCLMWTSRQMQLRLFLWMYTSQTFMSKHNYEERGTFKIYHIFVFRVKHIFSGSATGTFTIASKSLFLKQ